MHAIYQHFSELIEQAVIQLCPNLFLNFPAAAELQVASYELTLFGSTSDSHSRQHVIMPISQQCGHW